MGDLGEPRSPFLIIDGQHRLAGLHFYLNEPDANRRVDVPCVIFDGKTAEFATEMFVVINSTHTRINKSHLIDLYERIEWGTDDTKRYAARLVRRLYEEGDSPLRYHLNMLGGRSQQDLWINQAQAYSEVHRLVSRPEAERWITDGRGRSEQRGYGLLRDVLRAARTVFGEAWGDNKRFMVTRDVTLKALLRLASDVAAAGKVLGITPGEDLESLSPGRSSRGVNWFASSGGRDSTNGFPRPDSHKGSKKYERDWLEKQGSSRSKRVEGSRRESRSVDQRHRRASTFFDFSM
jgi:DGQHR domain-containing protein